MIFMTIEKMGSPCLFTRQQAFKMGCFYWLHVKNSNHLQTESSLDHLKDTKFYLESKAFFICISGILRNYLLQLHHPFSDVDE